jgi:EAL domain-containing protein (putative c-di-GMP-specific phosphodiesterase class I)
VPIGEFVLAQAIQQLGRWRASHEDLSVSVNLSARQLSDERLPDLIAELCRRHLVPPSSVCLELTETALMTDTGGRSTQMLDRLRAVGARLALDDFGTGYSSLARLSQLRLSAVKIDRSFIQRMLSDPTAAAVVDAVVRMADAIGVTVIAEGVETEAELARVADLGCPYAQGYLFSRPLEPHAAQQLLSSAHAQLRAA